MRYLLPALMLLAVCIPRAATAHERELLDANPTVIVCTDIKSGVREFAQHRAVLRMEQSFISRSDEILFMPAACSYRIVIGRVLLPMRAADTAVNGQLVRTYFFIAYDITWRRVVYALKDVLLKDRLCALTPLKRGFFLKNRGVQNREPPR